MKADINLPVNAKKRVIVQSILLSGARLNQQKQKRKMKLWLAQVSHKYRLAEVESSCFVCLASLDK